MLLPATGGEMTTVLLVLIGLIVVGLFSRAIRVLATICTLGFAAFAALLVWQPGKLGNQPPPLKPAAFRCPEGVWARDPIVETFHNCPTLNGQRSTAPARYLPFPTKRRDGNRPVGYKRELQASTSSRCARLRSQALCPNGGMVDVNVNRA